MEQSEGALIPPPKGGQLRTGRQWVPDATAEQLDRLADDLDQELHRKKHAEVVRLGLGKLARLLRAPPDQTASGGPSRRAPLSDAVGSGRRPQGREAQAEDGAAPPRRDRCRAPRGWSRIRHAASDPQTDHERNSAHLWRAPGGCAGAARGRHRRDLRDVRSRYCARSATRRSFCSDSRAASAARKSSRSMSSDLEFEGGVAARDTPPLENGSGRGGEDHRHHAGRESRDLPGRGGARLAQGRRS